MDRNKGKRQHATKAFLVFAAAAFLLVTGVGGARADSLTLTGAGPAAYNGVYVGPYPISVNNAASTPMICDDYGTDISQHYSWTASSHTFVNSQPLSAQLSGLKFAGNTSFGDEVALSAGQTYASQAYEEVFYLSSQMMLQQQTSTNPNLAAIHYAIWQIMEPDANLAIAGRGNTSPDSNAYWLNRAAANYATVNTADFTVYTPANLTPGAATNGSDRSQEFISMHGSPVPVPPSVLLLGTGLLGFVGLRKRPKK